MTKKEKWNNAIDTINELANTDFLCDEYNILKLKKQCNIWLADCNYWSETLKVIEDVCTTLFKEKIQKLNKKK